METLIRFVVMDRREVDALARALELVQTGLYDGAFGELNVSLDEPAGAVGFEMQPGSEDKIAAQLGQAEVASAVEALLRRETPGEWSGIFWAPNGFGGRLGWAPAAAQGLRSILEVAQRHADKVSPNTSDRILMLATLQRVLRRF